MLGTRLHSLHLILQCAGFRSVHHDVKHSSRAAVMCINYDMRPDSALQLALAAPPFEFVDDAYPASLCPIMIADDVLVFFANHECGSASLDEAIS